MRILVVSEFHHLPTGYATYYKNICEALHNAGHKVFELASYGNENLPEHIKAAKKCPWDVYLNIPDVRSPKSQEYLRAKESRFDTEFGSWNFENTVLDCWPDVVIAIRDHWYDKFIMESPLAKYYRVVLSPTVDSRPQKGDWLDTFQKVDALTFYNEWSKDWMVEQYNGKNIVDYISPGPDLEYKPLDKEKSRKSLGLPLKNKILLTVMRNQGRKQYPYLFEAFSKLKDKTTLLYCHTHFQDRGWDLPKLALQYGISDRLYFTYKCTECLDISADILKSNNKCLKCNGQKDICSVQDGVTTKELNLVYNSADLYVQWANCLPPGEQVLLKTGWTNIENVKSGDIALTNKNNWKEVIDISEKLSDGELIKFKIRSCLGELTVSSGHPLFVINKDCGLSLGKRSLKEAIGNKLRQNKFSISSRPVKAKDVAVGDFIAYPIDKTEIEYDTIDLTSLIPSSYKINEDAFNSRCNKINFPIKINVDNNFIKWVGLYVADGCTQKIKNKGPSQVFICANSKEKRNIDLSKLVLSKLGNVKVSKYKNRNAVNISICNKVFGQYMLNNCKKHERKKLPDWVMTLPVEKQKLVMQGLFMGDGCYFASKNISIYHTISKVLAEQIEQLCRRIGINYNCNLKTKKGNRKPQYRFEIRGNISAGDFCTKRTSTCNFIHNDYYYYQIKSIEKIPYTGLVYNIEVKDDNSYVSKIGAVKNSEGLGVPQIEAAATGLKLITVNFSAPEDVAKKTISFAIDPLSLQREMGTLCNRAIPDNEALIKLLDDESSWVYNKEEVVAKLKENYDWAKTGEKWVSLVESMIPKNCWGKTPTLVTPPSFDQLKDLPIFEFVKACILNVAQEKDMLGSFAHGEALEHLDIGFFIPEDKKTGHKSNTQKQVTKEMVYKKFLNILENKIQWERKKNTLLPQKSS